ncbi:MAG: RagB/SusD family nutrient uptake outer membrane protein [Capnocytophaga sp.]|nr:MAG: RagB/SusD family nutrient uptake outer membrane protein [Capnocytophaga sp.]
MKRLYYIFSAAFLALAGCNKQLDELPDNQVRIDSPEKVRKLLVNAYPLASGFILNEFSSDNIGDGGSLLKYESRFNGEIANWETINEYSNSEGLYYVWQYHYQAINHANTALEAIDKLGNTPELQAARGEALVARAYAHFELVNLFGKPYNRSTSASDPGIPYMLAPETELNKKYERTSVAKVYQQIDADLQEGIPLINDSYYSMPKYHFNKKAANAFAARFYLYYQEWQKALDAANEVLTTNDRTTKNLLRNWEDFRDVSKVGSPTQGNRALYYTRDDIQANLLILPIYSQITTYYSDVYSIRYAHNSRVSNQETLGAKNLWDTQGKSVVNERYWFMPIKYEGNEANIVFFDKWPILAGGYRSIIIPFTTDETLLVRAEAKIHLKQYESAVNDLNLWTSKFIQVKEVDGFTNKNQFTEAEIIAFYNGINYSQATDDGATQKKQLNPSFTILADGVQEPLLHYVLQCRRVLTLGEGLRWQDVRRYNIEVVRYETDNVNRNLFTVKSILPPSDLRRTLQLPTMVLQAGMTPNPR